MAATRTNWATHTTSPARPGEGRSVLPPSVDQVPPVDPEAVLAQADHENFPVATRFLPRDIRDHLLAIYGFARLVDDLGDEAPGDRLAHLDWIEAELERAAVGEATHPLLRRLTPTLRACALPLDPFRRLIEANRVDQRVDRYATFEELLTYCQLSATPVGELVLGVFGLVSPHHLPLSDAVCTGLQLVEHWQDVAEDWSRGRVYLPEEDLRRFGVSRADLAASRATARLRELLACEVARTRALLRAGHELAADVPLRPRLAVAGFAAGGLAACDAIEAAGYDVLAHRCRPSRARVARLAVTILWSARRGPAA